jgi:phage gpG-like protein
MGFFDIFIEVDTSQATSLFMKLDNKLGDLRQEFNNSIPIINDDIEDHFNKTIDSKGQIWKPSKRALKTGTKTLTDTASLRLGLKAFNTSDNLGLEIKPTGKNSREDTPTKDYAFIHNFGGKFKAFGKYETTMPQREFAWLTPRAKEGIATNIAIGLQNI